MGAPWTISTKEEDNTQAETEAAGWSGIGGGFSSVKPTEGFGNVQWGNTDGGASGFGSFSAAESEQFDFGKLINNDAATNVSDEKVKEVAAGDGKSKSKSN